MVNCYQSNVGNRQFLQTYTNSCEGKQDNYCFTVYYIYIYHTLQDIETFPDYKLVELYRNTDDLHVQSLALKQLLERHNPDHMVDGNNIKTLLEKIRFSASQSANQDWLVNI